MPKSEDKFRTVLDNLPGHKSATVIRKGSDADKKFLAETQRMEKLGSPEYYGQKASRSAARKLAAVTQFGLSKERRK